MRCKGIADVQSGLLNCTAFFTSQLGLDLKELSSPIWLMDVCVRLVYWLARGPALTADAVELSQASSVCGPYIRRDILMMWHKIEIKAQTEAVITKGWLNFMLLHSLLCFFGGRGVRTILVERIHNLTCINKQLVLSTSCQMTTDRMKDVIFFPKRSQSYHV